MIYRHTYTLHLLEIFMIASLVVTYVDKYKLDMGRKLKDRHHMHHHASSHKSK